MIPKWFKKLLRKWLLDPEEEDPTLDCVFIVEGERKLSRCTVVGAVGGCLKVQPYDSGLGERMVGESGVSDKKKFWRLWKRFQGNSVITWEDGSPFETMEN